VSLDRFFRDEILEMCNAGDARPTIPVTSA
jgi:hypothetical protein